MLIVLIFSYLKVLVLLAMMAQSYEKSTEVQKENAFFFYISETG